MAEAGDGDHAARLSALAGADPAALKALAEAVLPDLPAVEVVQSRTGLVMMPLRDSVQGTDFHLGEVLVAEAHLRAGAAEGYGLIPGRDLERAMAMAVLDLAHALGIARPGIEAFAAAEAAAAHARDERTLRDIAATRVEMETF